MTTGLLRPKNPEQASANRASRIADLVRANEHVPVLVSIAAIWAVFAAANDRFLTPGNLTNLTLQIVGVGAISVGVVFVLLLGEIDLSVGALSGFAAGLMAILNVHQGQPAWLAIVVAVVGGGLVGTLQGVVITTFRLPAFVVTLAGLLVWQGALLLLLGSSGTINLTDSIYLTLSSDFVGRPVGWAMAAAVIVVRAAVALRRRSARVDSGLAVESVKRFAGKQVAIAAAIVVAVAILSADRGIPISLVVLLVLVATGDLIVRRTRFGRYVMAVGSNIEAARRAGIRTDHIRVAVFAIAGAMAGAGGVLAASRLLAVNQGSGGSDLLLLAIAGPVIAGVSLFGARGSVWAALTGAVVIGSIANGMDLLSFSSSVKFMVTGVVLLVAVILDAISRSRTGTGNAR